MKVFELSYAGARPAKAIKMPSRGEWYYALLFGSHEETGWQVRIPLGISDFPCYADSPATLTLDEDYGLLPLNSRDLKGNPSKLLIRGQEDPGVLVLFDPTCPGCRGELDWGHWGKTKELLTGSFAERQDRAAAPAPILQAGGPMAVQWKWSQSDNGRYWLASYDGAHWDVRREK
jgi:hypothetical protein